MKVRYKKSAQKSLSKMQPKKALKIIDAMEQVAKDPHKSDPLITPLEGVENGYRRRFGDLRVLYTIENEIEILEVFKIGSRGGVYK